MGHGEHDERQGPEKAPRDVYRVEMVVFGEALLSMEGGPIPATIEEPLRVPAGELCAVAGVGVEELPGLRFVSSSFGFQPA